jgi:DNA repair exonuclease SbcCD ATPase subunit
MYISLCAFVGIILFAIATFLVSSVPVVSTILFLLMVVAAVAAAFLYKQYRTARTRENTLKAEEQEAISQAGMMVVAREAAQRMAGNTEALVQVEQEIRSLGSNIPRSLEEAQQFLERTKNQSDPGDIQQRLQMKRDEAKAALNRVNASREACVALQKERERLEHLRKKEQWDTIEKNLSDDQRNISLMHQELTMLAGQEGLPLPSINARIQSSPIPSDQSFSSGPLAPLEIEEDTSSIPELADLVKSTIKATEHEIVSLDGKLDMVSELANQTRDNQAALDLLLERQRSLQDRSNRYQSTNPAQQLESAREQQMALRSAQQSLIDSLRQRAENLNITYSQAAANNAETAARKQLEELHITLGNKVMLQGRQEHFTEVLKERQESLSDYYKQLAKFSNTLGSWIVPPNPFAEALVALRSRCQNEIQEANEDGILKDLDALNNQEAASNTKIQLCHEVIVTDHDAITDLFVQRDQLSIKSYERSSLVETWPLLGQYVPEDRSRLEAEHQSLEDELAELRQQAEKLRAQLGIGDEQLSLADARSHMEALERDYEVKKHGHTLLQEVEVRLLRKVLPRTEYYMQQILPLLTGGRYHDVHLITEPEEGTVSGGAFQIQVWDTAAGEYVPTSALSGGAADQLSLALRLAFAIATLPRDLNAAPGFVLLDEPLSSFDRGRAQALVDVVTGEVLSRHFEQIILLSHSSAFDPAMFPYHLYMDNGLIVESNLPIVQAPLPATPLNQSGLPATPFPSDFDMDDDVTVAVPAIKLPLDK